MLQISDSQVITGIIAGTIVLALLGSFIISFFFIQKARKKGYEQEKQLLQSQHQQELLQTQLEIQEQTLKTISEEIHDNISQLMGLAKLNINNLLATLPLDALGPRAKAEAAKESVSKAINDIRQLARTLHGDKIAETGLEQAIDAQLKVIQNSGSFTTQLTVSGEPYPLEPKQEMVLFRMVQELLNNAVKHSQGKQVHVALNYGTDVFTITVSDDGQGYDTNGSGTKDTGIGFTSLRNRAALINAQVAIDTAVGKGTAVTIHLPLK
jgi:two-component system, NarL family, sensor kinase